MAIPTKKITDQDTLQQIANQNVKAGFGTVESSGGMDTYKGQGVNFDIGPSAQTKKESTELSQNQASGSSQTGSQSPYDKAQQEYLNLLGSKATPAMTAEQIKQQELEKAQALIDATQSVYLEELAKIQKQGEANLQQTKSINVGAGLAGSPFKTTQEAKTQAITDQAVSGVQKARKAEIASIMASAQNRSDQRFQQEREFAMQEKNQAINEAALRLDFLNKQKQDAQDKIKMLAQGGYSLDELDQQTYQSMLDQSGLTEFEAQALYNLNNPEATAKYEIQGDTMVGFYIDPVTGKPKITTQKIEGLGEKEINEPNIQEFGGVPYIIGTDAEGNVVGEVLPGFKGPEPEGQTPLTETVDGTLLQYNPETNKWDVAFGGSKKSPSMTQEDLDQVLSIKEAKDLGVPYGTTVGGAIKQQKEGAFDQSQVLIDLIQEIAGDQSFTGVVGPWSSKLPTLSTLFGDEKAINAKINQMKNLLTVENLDLMTGVLSESDIKILEGAATILDKSLPQKDFIEALVKVQDTALKAQYNLIGVSDMDYEGAKKELGVAGVKQFIENNKDLITNIPTAQPTSEPFNSDQSTSLKGSGDVLSLGQVTGFGSPYWKWGLDIDLKVGDKVPTPASGEVVYVGKNGGFGNQVQIKTAQGNIIWLSHLDSAGVKVGDKVTKGQFIGIGGNSGSVIPVGGGDGSHLDLTVLKPDGTYMDPNEIYKSLIG